MKRVLSIQSHVAYGYVGNKAAVFPLQNLGHDVSFINTVQFSNHTGYGSWTGDVFSEDHIRDVLKGLEDREILEKLDVILSGYLGDASLGQAILDTVEKIRKKNKNLIYACDPVMGDVGRGLFVREDIPDFFQKQALSMANVITPNLYELGLLSNHTIKAVDDTVKACDILHQMGPKTILVTSVDTNDQASGIMQMLLSDSTDGKWLISTPKIEFEIAPNGSGDLTAALFTGHLIEGNTPSQALEKTASSIFDILMDTHNAESRELRLIQNQSAIRNPDTSRFKAEKI